MKEANKENKTTIPDSNIESQWVLVTPELAKYYLESNVKNRSVRDRHVVKMISDMTNKRWEETHMGIGFDENGVLVDGQHRLYAIIQSNTPQWILITTGLSENARSVIDIGAKRKAADFLPGAYRDMRSSAIRYLLALHKRNGESFTAQQLAYDTQQITNAEIQEAWFNFYDDFERMGAVANEASKNVAFGPSSLIVASIVYPKRQEEFLDGIYTQAMLPVGDPRLALIKFRGGQTATNPSTGKVRGPTPVGMFVSMKAAKAFNDEKSIGILRFHKQEKLKI